jgi:hypothetical protein
MSFPTVHEVAPGDKITSTQWNELAASANARMLAGYGDPTWRIWWKVLSATRGIVAAEDLDSFLNFWIHQPAGPARPGQWRRDGFGG